MSASDTLVKDNPPRDQYTASSAETTFPFNFLIFDSKDLVVLETTDPGTSQETTTELVEGTDYSVSGVGNEDGGSITLTSGANDGDIYTLYRDSVIERLTDFLQTGDFSAENINKSLDVLTTILQEFEVEFKRAATLPESSIIDDLDLPKPEADHYIRWNTNADDLENVQPENVAGLTEEQVEDIVGGLIAGGTNVSVNYDDANNTLTISASGGSSRTEEEVEDIVNGLLTSSGVLTLTYNDSTNELVIGVSEGNISLANLGSHSHADLSDSPASAHHTAHTHPGDKQATSDITDDQNNTIYDYSNQHVPLSVQETQRDNDFSLSLTHTKWAAGLSSEEIYRIQLQSGETLTVDRIEFRQKGGGTNSNVSVEVYDSTAASSIGTQTLGGTTLNPGSSGTGNLVLVNVSNSSGGAVNGSLTITGEIT